MFIVLVASNAMEGTLAPYRPPYFQTWTAGAWARNSWGINDEFTLSVAPPSLSDATVDILRIKRHRTAMKGGR